MKPGDILLAEAGEVDGVDLFGIVEIRNALAPRIKGTHISLEAELVFGIRPVDWRSNEISVTMNRSLENSGHALSSNIQDSPFFFSARVSTPIILASG